MAININELAESINKELARYSHGVGEETVKLAEKVAKAGVQQLKSTSPKLTGSYSKGWRVKKVDGNFVVHNATDYQLTHLLEKGHAKVGGGRVPAKVHIKPVEDQMIDEFEKGVEEAIRNR